MTGRKIARLCCKWHAEPYLHLMVGIQNKVTNCGRGQWYRMIGRQVLSWCRNTLATASKADRIWERHRALRTQFQSERVASI
jgi:hypothetical protein